MKIFNLLNQREKCIVQLSQFFNYQSLILFTILSSINLFLVICSYI